MKKTSVPKTKKVQDKLKTTFEEEKVLYLTENDFEKTLLFCQNEAKLLLKNTFEPKRIRFWKILLYLKENLCSKLLQFVQKQSVFLFKALQFVQK